MLRVSSQSQGEEVDLRGIVEGDAVESGVPFGSELIQFAETALGEDDEVIRKARDEVAEKMGNAAMVDAAGVIANFQRMVRIADGTGIPLDTPVAMMTDDVRGELGINDYGSAENTPPLNIAQKILARVLQPILPGVIKFMTRDMTRNKYE